MVTWLAKVSPHKIRLAHTKLFEFTGWYDMRKQFRDDRFQIDFLRDDGKEMPCDIGFLAVVLTSTL